MHRHVFFLLVFGSSVLAYTKPDTLCDENDAQCITKKAQEIVRTSVQGSEELGLEPLDPMYQELIEGGESDLKYWFRDSTVTGFKDLITNEVKYVSPVDLHLEFTFPRLEMSGKLEIIGKLFNTPVKANVKYHLIATNLHLRMNSTRDIYIKDGKTYFKHVNIKTHTELLGTLHLDQETYEENDKLPEDVLQSLNDNPKKAVEVFQYALGDANIKVMFESINKLHEIVPLEDLLITGSYKE